MSAEAAHAGAAVRFERGDQDLRRMCSAASDRPCGSRPGEFFSIIGPSGSGKTTLLGIIAGFVTPTGGAHARSAAATSSASPPYRRNIGMVFQNYALFPHMTVVENIAFPLRMRGMPDGRDRASASSAMLGHGAARRASAIAARRSSRAASSSAWRWRAPPSTTRSSC